MATCQRSWDRRWVGCAACWDFQPRPSSRSLVNHATHLAHLGQRGAMPLLSSSRGEPSLTSLFFCQHPFERLTALRRQASTKATPLVYKQRTPSSKKNPTAPPTGFAAVGSYNTIARRYDPTDRGPSFTNGFQVDCYYCWYSFRGGDKLRTVSTRYGLYDLRSSASC